MSVTTIKPNSIRVSHHQIPIIYDPSCRPLLTSQVLAALDELIPLLMREAEQKNVPVLKVDVRSFYDPEEDSHQIVVRQWVKLPADQAFRYWDGLGPAYETWMHSAPEISVSLYADQIAFEVRWSEDENEL